jgi:hypothetical protein
VNIMSELPVPVSVASGEDAKLDKLAGSGFLPRVQLMDKGSGPVMDQKIQMGRFAFISGKNQIHDLTASFEGLVLARRPKALRAISGSAKSVHDMASKEWEEIEKLANSGQKNTGCSYGTEYLIWVRQNRSYATYFCNSPTQRNASPGLNTILNNWAKHKTIKLPAVLFRCEMVTSQKNGQTFKWFAPIFDPCSTPFSELPDPAEMAEHIQKFVNPPKGAVKEEVEGEGVSDRG